MGERFTEFRIAVVGLEGCGKSSLIQRLCTGVFSDTPHTETEQQSTALWDRTFVFFWEFPTAVLTDATSDELIVGFGGVVFLFDLNKIDPDGLQEAKVYLTSVMKHPSTANVPFVLVGTKSDLVEEFEEIRPSMLMSTLTEHVKKTQLLLISAKTESGIREVQEWILNRANPAGPIGDAQIV
jgi:GTPase SAR1 family protein